jgi:hypothetical protein
MARPYELRQYTPREQAVIQQNQEGIQTSKPK